MPPPSDGIGLLRLTIVAVALLLVLWQRRPLRAPAAPVLSAATPVSE